MSSAKEEIREGKRRRSSSENDEPAATDLKDDDNNSSSSSDDEGGFGECVCEARCESRGGGSICSRLIARCMTV